MLPHPFQGILWLFVLITVHRSAAGCKFLLMTGKTTGSGACEGESTRDGEVFFPLPRVILAVSVWLRLERWVPGRAGEREQTQLINYSSCCHSCLLCREPGWGSGAKLALQAQAFYTQTGAESKGFCAFSVTYSSSFLCCQAFLLSVVTCSTPDMLGSRMDSEPVMKFNGGASDPRWRWMSLWVHH